MYFVVARIPIIDMTVSVLFAATMTAWLAGEHGAGKTRWGYWALAGLFLGLAILAKGPVCIILFGAVVLIYLVAVRRPTGVFAAAGFPVLLAALAALPWFLAAQRANPAFFHYFFMDQNIDRFLGRGRPEHVQPFYFYLVLLAPGFGIWSLYWPSMARAMHRHWRDWSPRTRQDGLFLIIWSATTILFFSASTCKLVQYMLPAWWPLAAATAAWLRLEFCRGEQKPRRRLYIPTILAAAAVALVVAAAIVYAGRQHKVPLAVLQRPVLIFALTGVVSVGLLLFASWLRNRHWTLVQLTVASLLPLVGMLPAITAITSTKDMNGLIPAQLMNLPKNTPWALACYKLYNQSFTYYTGHRVILIGTPSEIPLGLLEPNADYWYPGDLGVVRGLSRRGPLALVTDLQEGERVAAQFGLRVWARNDDRAMLVNPAGHRLLSDPGSTPAIAPRPLPHRL